MPQESTVEDVSTPNALFELNRLINNPEATYVTVEQLINKGFAPLEAQLIITIGVELTQARQKKAVENQVNLPQLSEDEIKFNIERNKRMEESFRLTMKLSDELKRSLIKNVTNTASAFSRVVLIYTISFILGIGLIITGVVFGAMNKQVLAVAFGTLGIIDIVTHFITLPANKIQESRSNLSQLQVVLLVWLKEFLNNDALTGRMLNVEKPSIEVYKELSKVSIDNTESLLKLIEQWAEPKI